MRRVEKPKFLAWGDVWSTRRNRGRRAYVRLAVVSVSSDVRAARLNSELTKLRERMTKLKDDIETPHAELVRNMELLRDQVAAESVAAQTCLARTADLEFKLDAKTSVGGTAGGACLRELDSVIGIKLREGEGTRQVGGRIYVGTTLIAAAAEHLWCNVISTADLGSTEREGIMHPGEAREVTTTVGIFRIAVTKVAQDNDGEYCILDLVRAR